MVIIRNPIREMYLIKALIHCLQTQNRERERAVDSNQKPTI